MDPLVTGVIAVLSTGSAVATWIGVKVWPFVRKLNHFVDDVAGEPPRRGVPARPGLMERMSTVETDLRIVKAEVKNSHGSNLRDDLDRVEAQLQGHISEVEPLIRDLHDQHARKRA